MDTSLINVDVLHNVTQFADFSTVLQLTKTCREFNAECAQYLLKDKVYLEGEESVQSFIDFLTASGDDNYARRRLPFCTNIELSVGPSPSQNLKLGLTILFARIKSKALRFKFLALHYSDALLAPDSLVPEVVAALTTLEELKLYEYGTNCAAMLPTMQSRLLAVRLARDSSELDELLNDPLLNPHDDPLYLLQDSQETLEYMNVTLPITLRQGFFPNLTGLRIYCPGWQPLTWTFIRAFPRLVDLAAGFGTELTQERAPMAVACRQWNIAEQRRLGTWTFLRQARGTLEDLFLLGLTCTIPELVISVFSLDDDVSAPDLELRRYQADAWRQVLGCARPSRLTLRIDDSDWILDNHGFELLTRTPELVSLKSLRLVVRVSYSMGCNPDTLGEDDGLDMLWVVVAPFIRPVDVSITFDWTGWSAQARRIADAFPDSREAARDTDFPREKLEAVDMEGHVRPFRMHENARSVLYSHVGPDGWKREARWFRPDVSAEEQAAIIEEAEAH
ncbi:hypothetical protein GSI_15585 [Ganoderma sinense ZZ0214-1]|uniref:F-box domain-containing protein n=1 Tax=Ganoderma sinense ZZ0214-1 TaxID=1077348 RepID=A0A2G8RN05_9APHY|nr:hypothetical protein GSI_15585 [Ganoderma sinense ZZ0214-1]